MSLIHTWIAAHAARGHTLSRAVAELNRATRLRYTLSRVGEWRNGKRDVPAKARQHMLREALPFALSQICRRPVLEDHEIRRLVEMLS